MFTVVAVFSVQFFRLRWWLIRIKIDSLVFGGLLLKMSNSLQYWSVVGLKSVSLKSVKYLANPKYRFSTNFYTVKKYFFFFLENLFGVFET